MTSCGQCECCARFRAFVEADITDWFTIAPFYRTRARLMSMIDASFNTARCTPAIPIEKLDQATARAWADAGIIPVAEYVRLAKLHGWKPDPALSQERTP